jgi:hypothetical protein
VIDIVAVSETLPDAVMLVVGNAESVALPETEAPFDNDDVGDTCRLLLPV